MLEPSVDPNGPTPYELLGGRDAALALAKAFYDTMEAHEPELTRLHRLDEHGRVHPEARERFALFLVGWLGGPQEYIQRHGHPRLRRRHGHVAIGAAMRDAWLRSMQRALDAQGVQGALRELLDSRFADLADFMRNQPEPSG